MKDETGQSDFQVQLRTKITKLAFSKKRLMK